MLDLNKDVKYIKGVGPNRVKLLNNLNIYTLNDLITYFPRTYEDRSKPKNICECINGEETLIEAVACGNVSEIRLKGKKMYTLIIRDETATAKAIWFNQSYLKNRFRIGEKYKFYGKINNVQGRITINSPVFEESNKNSNTGKIIPIYPLTYNFSILFFTFITIYFSSINGQSLSGSISPSLTSIFNSTFNILPL